MGHRIPGQGAENEQGWSGILGTQPLSCRALMLQPSQEAAARPNTAGTQDITVSGRALPLILVRQIPAFSRKHGQLYIFPLSTDFTVSSKLCFYSVTRTVSFQMCFL